MLTQSVCTYSIFRIQCTDGTKKRKKQNTKRGTKNKYETVTVYIKNKGGEIESAAHQTYVFSLDITDDGKNQNKEKQNVKITSTVCVD